MKEKTTKLHSLEEKVKEHQQEMNNLQNQLQENENILRRRFEERINNLQNQLQESENILQRRFEERINNHQTEINEQVNTNHNKVKKEISNDRKAFLCFIFIFVGVVSVFSYQIYMNCESKIAVVESQLKTKLDEVQRNLPYGSHTFTWKITGFEYIFSQARKRYQTMIQSDPFYIFGYKLKLLIYPDGNGNGAGSHTSVFIVVMKGGNDAILSWPFFKRVTFTLIDQQEHSNDRENIILYFKPNPKNEYFGRPVTDRNKGWGFSMFVSHDKLRERRYIVDDTIFIQVELATLLS